MYITPKIGFLFDVDGTLTYYRGNDSSIDLLIINDLEMIRQKGHPIGLVTGRSVDWVRNIFFNYISPTLREYIQIYGEFGLVSLIDGKKTRRRIGKETREALTSAKEKIIQVICEDRDLEPITSFSAPDRRSLWIEPKEIMLTFRTLPLLGLTSDVFKKLIDPIIKEYSELLKLELNPYAADILPIFANKKTAAEKAIQKLDPDKKIEKWFAFGDSESDKEMGKAKGKKVQFYLIPRGETSRAHYIIQRLLIGKE
ncbi:MAG: HAD-IIB family hydrolase [Candidatus Heimdallarchaeota archaeon]|nr:HAD-IIB family hydrolase [Candidatus Heimdallarchaeota archaeon]